MLSDQWREGAIPRVSKRSDAESRVHGGATAPGAKSGCGIAEGKSWMRVRASLAAWCCVTALVTTRGLCGVATFVDRTAELGLAIDTNAACWVDIDNDGWVDLCAGGAVWRNDDGKRFARLADVGTVVSADYDNDGYADLFSWSSLRLYHNDGGKGFAEAPLPQLPRCVSRGACWTDFDNDGSVDLYIGGYEDWDAGVTYPSIALRNTGDGLFVVAWTDERYRARGITACDFDEDGDADIYASNYRLQPNVLWLNDGTGHFTDEAAGYNAVATSEGFDGGHSIGAAWGDFDNDGHFDLFAGNFAHVDDRGDQPKSRFLRNLGPDASHSFEDMGPCGVFYQESYATPAAGDYDNDGDLDLFFTTVYGTASFGRPNHPVLYRNDRGFAFADDTAAAGLGGLPPTSQAAWADFDNDGDLDLVGGGKLFVNQGTGGHWLKVRLEGDGRAVNRWAVGAQARVSIDGGIVTRQVEAGTGEGNQNDLTLHFGLGAWTAPMTLEVRWPGGVVQQVENVVPDSTCVVRYGDAEQGPG